jgi:hypothetical protein
MDQTMSHILNGPYKYQTLFIVKYETWELICSLNPVCLSILMAIVQFFNITFILSIDRDKISFK